MYSASKEKCLAYHSEPSSLFWSQGLERLQCMRMMKMMMKAGAIAFYERVTALMKVWLY
jgi:hypothetical protein